MYRIKCESDWFPFSFRLAFFRLFHCIKFKSVEHDIITYQIECLIKILRKFGIICVTFICKAKNWIAWNLSETPAVYRELGYVQCTHTVCASVLVKSIASNKENAHKMNNEFSVFLAIIIKFMFISYVFGNFKRTEKHSNTHTHTSNKRIASSQYIYVICICVWAFGANI